MALSEEREFRREDSLDEGRLGFSNTANLSVVNMLSHNVNLLWSPLRVLMKKKHHHRFKFIQVTISKVQGLSIQVNVQES
eukprot:m.335481 g.335481  ORF g.335481 m.335481 type:complete len:80 (-) comp17605_c0_seq1:38-277(-)